MAATPTCSSTPEGRAQLVDGTEGGRRVVEPLGGAEDLVAVIAQLALDVQGAVPVERNAIEQGPADVERRHAEAAQQPLVGAGGHEVDARGGDVDREHADGLHGIGIQIGAVGVGQVGQRPQVVAEAVLVRHPRHRHQAGPGVDRPRHVVGEHRAVAGLDDPQRDAARPLQLAVEDEAGVVVQLVDHHVVARRQPESAGDDVLAFAGRIEERDLVGGGADEAGVAGAHAVGGPLHLAERRWASRSWRRRTPGRRRRRRAGVGAM